MALLVASTTSATGAAVGWAYIDIDIIGICLELLTGERLAPLLVLFLVTALGEEVDGVHGDVMFLVALVRFVRACGNEDSSELYRSFTSEILPCVSLTVTWCTPLHRLPKNLTVT